MLSHLRWQCKVTTLGDNSPTCYFFYPAKSWCWHCGCFPTQLEYYSNKIWNCFLYHKVMVFHDSQSMDRGHHPYHPTSPARKTSAFHGMDDKQRRKHWTPGAFSNHYIKLHPWNQQHHGSLQCLYRFFALWKLTTGEKTRCGGFLLWNLLQFFLVLLFGNVRLLEEFGFMFFVR